MATWVIIGASRGLGYEFLRQISAADATNVVIGTARTPSAVEAQLKADGLSPPRVRIHAADLDDHASLRSAAAAVAEQTGGAIDYLVVNGAYQSAPTAAMQPTGYAGKEDLLRAELEQSMLTNAIGPLNAINAFLPLVRKGKAKKVIVLSSGLADREATQAAKAAYSLPYSVSKAAVNLIVTHFAVELRNEGVALLSLAPGLVHTWQNEQELAFLTQHTRDNYEPRFRGAITPEQSVRAMMKVIDGLSVENSGAFLSQLGTTRWVSADGVGDEVVAAA